MAANQPVLQGGIQQTVFANHQTFDTVIEKNPDFPAWSPVEQSELAQMFFNEKYSDFTPEEQTEIAQQFSSKYKVALPEYNVQPLDLQEPTKLGQGPGLKNFNPSPIEQMDNTLKGLTYGARNQHPVLAQGFDLVTGRGFNEGVLEGLSAYGYQPEVLPNENSITGAQRQAGSQFGGLLGPIGASIGATPFVGLPAYAAAAEVNRQNRQYGRTGDQLDYRPIATKAGLGLVEAFIPGATQGGKLARGLTGAGLGLPFNIADNVAEQVFDTGNFNVTDPNLWGNMAQGGAVDAALSILMGGKAKGGKNVNNPPSAVPPQSQPLPTTPPGAIQGQVSVSAQPAMTPKQAAQKIYDMLNSQNAEERADGKAALDRFRSDSKDKKRRSGTVKKEGNRTARLVLAELDILKGSKAGKAQKPRLSKTEIDRLVKAGTKLRREGGERKANFNNYLNANVSKEDRQIINARIGEEIGTRKETEKKRSTDARKKREDRAKKKAKAEQDAKKKAIDEENQKIEAELKKQKEEAAAQELLESVKTAIETTAPKKTGTDTELVSKGPDEYSIMAKEAGVSTKKPKATETAPQQAKVTKTPSSMPKVLTREEIEVKAEELFQHYLKGEKGTLDAKVSKTRSISKADFTKGGKVDQSRSDAINETHAKILDRFNQKKTEADKTKEGRKKPENIVRAKAANIKELEDTEKAGGSYDFNTGKGKQKPLKSAQLKWSEVRDSIDDSALQEWGDVIDDAMQNDGSVLIRYDSERSGDTGEFEYKEVSPIDWGFNFSRDDQGNIVGARAVFHGVNKNGHTGEYYLQPSDANPKTGTVSGVLEKPVLIPSSEGKAPRNTDPNVYKGPRDFKIADIMSRPARKTQGLTSELQLKVSEAQQTLADIANNRKGSHVSVSAAAVNKAAKKSKAVRDIIQKDKVPPKDLKNASQEVSDMGGQNKRDTDKGAGC